MLTKICSLALIVFVSKGFYDLSLTTIDNKIVTMDRLKGKSIAIGIVDSESPDLSFISFLDSLQGARADIQVVILPANDLSKKKQIGDIYSVYKNLKTSVAVLKPTPVLSSSKEKSDLTKWLTAVDMNEHFQIDLVEANTIFIVSQTGELKSVLAKGFPAKALIEALQ